MDPVSIATSVYTALDKLKTAIEQVSNEIKTAFSSEKIRKMFTSSPET